VDSRIMESGGCRGFSYNPETGIVLKGNRTCGSITRKGYLRTRVNGKCVMVHRLIWFIMTSKWPSINDEIDHIDGNRTNNKWDNLRLVDRRVNSQNLETHRKGHVLGAHKAKRGRWESSIRVDGTSYYLGNYKTPKEAGEAYRNAELIVMGVI
jgi:hypothetical protein